MIFKFALLELTQGTFRLTFQSAPPGTEAEPHIRHLASPVPVVSPQILEASVVPTGSFLAIFQESNLRSFPGKTATNHTINQGTRLLLVGFC